MGERNGIRNLIDEFPEISGVEFVPHPYLYRAIFPEHDINRISTARTSLDMSRFPADFPTLSRCANQTWGAMMDYRIRDPKLKALVSVMWAYYGLPPSRLATFSISLSSFQVFLGLKKDLAKDLSGKDSEIFVEPGYDLEASYEAARKADVANCGMGVTIYDNLFPGYS